MRLICSAMLELRVLGLKVDDCWISPLIELAPPKSGKTGYNVRHRKSSPSLAHTRLLSRYLSLSASPSLLCHNLPTMNCSSHVGPLEEANLLLEPADYGMKPL